MKEMSYKQYIKMIEETREMLEGHTNEEAITKVIGKEIERLLDEEIKKPPKGGPHIKTKETTNVQ